jgi:CRISPR-associated protein Csm1
LRVFTNHVQRRELERIYEGILIPLEAHVLWWFLPGFFSGKRFDLSMSVQIFLQGKLLGIEEFLQAPAKDGSAGSELLLAGRSHWLMLLSEVLPRALLAEFGLARILLGASGGGSFLLVLPSEMRPQADEFLNAANAQIGAMSGHTVRLVWAVTENLGDWSDVRKRLNEDMSRRIHTLADSSRQGTFSPFVDDRDGDDDYFTRYLSSARDAATAAWSPEAPGRVLLNDGKHKWPLGANADAIPLARHVALSEDGAAPATLPALASRASGMPVWGVLRAAVDNFDVRMRRTSSDAEFIQLSLVFRQFFAGELEMACSMPEFWRKVTILYSGVDDFAVYGSWDALLLLAREMQRVFHRFTDANLKELPGPEGKSITMALAFAPRLDEPFARVWEDASRRLEIARASAKDSLHVFGRCVDWRQVAHAAELRDTMLRMIRDFRCPPQFLNELNGFYRDKPIAAAGASRRLDRPWRYHRRFNSVLPGAARDREFQRIRTALITDLIGKSHAQVKLRPAGAVAVQWARFSLESGVQPTPAQPNALAS